MSGIVYFIQPSEYISTNIYKIGYSQQSLLNRIKQYGNNTSIICVLGTNNALATEKQLISAFNSRFVKFKGKEYFIIEDIQNAKNIFYNVCNLKDKSNSNSEETIDFNLKDNSDVNISVINEKVGLNNSIIYKCETCNYTTTRKSNLITHKSSKKHIQNVDNSKDNSDVKISVNLNEKEKVGLKNSIIYKCKTCKYTTTRKSNLITHKSSKKHKQNVDKLKNTLKYNCKVCNYKTDCVSHFKQHLKTDRHKSMKTDSNSDFYSEYKTEEKQMPRFNITEAMFYEMINCGKQLIELIEKRSKNK
jgi:hypothetical protein